MPVLMVNTPGVYMHASQLSLYSGHAICSVATSLSHEICGSLGLQPICNFQFKTFNINENPI